MRWLEILSVSLYVLDRTGSPFLVALMMVVRMSPMVLLGTVAGVLAERWNRKRLLAGGLALMLVLAASLAVALGRGELPLPLLAAAIFLSGTFFTTDFPVRRTLLGEAAGPGRLGTAMALDSATNNATRMLGPLAGGAVYQLLGLEGTYLIATVVYGVCLLLALLVPYRDGPRRGTALGGVLGNIAEGFRYARADPRIRSTLLVTMIVNLWGFPFATMVPVIGRETLALDPVWVGILASAEGAGAFTGALAVALIARPPLYTRIYRGGSILFLGAVLVFSQLRSLPAAWTVMAIGGLGVAGFASMQSTILLVTADPAFRSRVMGLLAVSIGVGPVGIAHVGWLAELVGPSRAVGIMAGEGLLALAWALRASRRK